MGDNIEIKNVKFTGVNRSAGFFTAPYSIIGFSEGIILSTGSVYNVPGPNISNSISSENNLDGDDDLNALIPGYHTYDATVLEFEFIPDNDTLSFRYVLGSDEYPEYVNSSYNDVFGLFVNGKNVALIPGTQLPVSINNLNEHKNNQYYRANHYGTNEINIELDAITTVLTATASVIPGEINTMKIAIADAGDYSFDSNIFIEAASFASIPIVFADPILEREIRSYLNKPTGEITKADVLGIERLNLSSTGISNLEGIQHLENLKELLLWDNNIHDVTPLSYLLNLLWLDIGGNEIEDISPLTNLTNLQLLNADNNRIQDISPINLMVQLLSLDLSENLIKFLGFNQGVSIQSSQPSNPFNKLTKLETLNLSNNQIDDVSNLSGLVNLRHLNLNENKVNDISDLNQLRSLQELSIAYNQLEDISVLSMFPDLIHLDLSYNQISDISSFHNLTQLKQAAMYNNRIENISPLSNLDNLTVLMLSDNDISLSEPLSQLNNLRILHLSNNPITDHHALDQLKNLLELYTDEKYYSAEHWEEQENVPTDKQWTIHFNLPVDLSTVSSDYIQVVNEDGEREAVTVHIGIDPKSVIVQAPQGGYDSGKTYYLLISQHIQSSSSKLLDAPISMKFTIANNTTSQFEVMSGGLKYVDAGLQVKDWYQFFNQASSIMDKLESENHFVNYVYQLPEDDPFKMLINQLSRESVWFFQKGFNEHLDALYPDRKMLPEKLIEVRGFFNEIRDDDHPLLQKYNIPDYSFESYLKDINGLVETAINNLYVPSIVSEPKSIYEYLENTSKAVKESTLKSIKLDHSLEKSGNWFDNLFSSTYKMKKGTSTQLNLTAVYSVLVKERSWWFDNRVNKSIDITKSSNSQWLSENRFVATVYQGNVKAIDKGDAVIKVRFFGKSAKINIEVQ